MDVSTRVLCSLGWAGLALLCHACSSPMAQEIDPPPVATVAPLEIAPLPSPPTDRPLRVGFLIVDGVYNTELTAPYDVFEHTRFRVDPGMAVFTVSPDGKPIRTAEGLVVQADHGFNDAPEIDILVVPSAEHSRDKDLENEEMIDWVRQQGEKATYVMSLCWGAFVLGEAGLLDGASCTTFPRDFDAFEDRFPKADLHREPSYVHHGRALTSQGGAKSFEAALYLVHGLYGEEVAAGIAGGLLIDWPPAPGKLRSLVVEG